ncbi:flagellar basal body rod protein FlgB [Azospira inquinata]|uniref:Flagellar basal body rod protein FlgB n=1 Tax=Azospira inquinata TaxID=2785627 RepID=A0A975SL84_9RHOO|nr:flagellar basal body rod protein FlgB [Azospira inquinata]QWT46274.1 flagellar basal body rod protein FlgB [Azospira inquinata]QWT48399.1 flagellar basal body rod protein FlgB [Azospira inquinata]
MMSKLDQEINFQHQALNLRAYRQQILATNIANADTPNYKARDIDFSSALGAALAGREPSSLALKTTSSRHLNGAQSGGPAELLYRQSYQPSADGNTVDMDVERSSFAENSVQYEALVQFIGDKFKTMRLAIQGQ